MVALPRQDEPEEQRQESNDLTIRELVREALEHTGGDWDRAQCYARDALAEDEALYKRLATSLIDSAIMQAIRKEVAWQRRPFMQLPQPDNPAGLVALAAVNQRSWHDFPLSRGVLLGDATDAKLDEEIETHEKIARPMRVKALWFRKIKEKKRGKPTVRAALSHKQLEKLLEEAERECKG